MRIRARDGERRRVSLWPLAFALALVGSFLVLAYLAASYAVYDTLAATTGECHPDDAANTPQRFRASGLDEAATAPYAMPVPEDVEFRSRDPQIAGLTLRGWWIPGRTATGPSVILVHGLKTCRRDENVLMAAGMLHRNGFGVLLMDQRDHGDSDDEDLRFAAGTEEYLDVLGAWDWVAAQGVPEDRIGILGHVVRGGDDGDRRRRGAPRRRRSGRTRRSRTWTRPSATTSPTRAIHRSWRPAGSSRRAIVAGDDLTAKSPLAEIAGLRGPSARHRPRRGATRC